MTTVATDGETIVADSRVSGDYADEGMKLYRVGKSIFGVSGDFTACMVFVDWLKTKRKSKPSIEDGSIEVLEVSPKGIFYWDSNLRPVKAGRRMAAIGSGSMAAMAAMMAGAKPEQAVRIACKLDNHSALPLKVEVL